VGPPGPDLVAAGQPPLPGSFTIGLAPFVHNTGLTPVEAVGPVDPVLASAAWSQRASSSLSLFSTALDGATGHATAFPEVSNVPLPMLEGEVCLPPEEEDECLTPKVLLHIVYEVVSQLENTEDFRQLSLKELSLCDILA
jgi:hypothetical protein